jgi:hypothetical protein
VLLVTLRDCDNSEHRLFFKPPPSVSTPVLPLEAVASNRATFCLVVPLFPLLGVPPPYISGCRGGHQWCGGYSCRADRPELRCRAARRRFQSQLLEALQLRCSQKHVRRWQLFPPQGLRLVCRRHVGLKCIRLAISSNKFLIL